MPAYFSIDLSIKNTDIYEGVYTDFITNLQKEGFRFISGSWEFFDEPIERIIEWNEKKLNENVELAVNEHCSNDYRQIVFDYHNFSEVRMFIVRVEEHNEYVFTIIIPEDELFRFDNGKVTYDPNILTDIKTLITNLWNNKYISAIQTTLELSGEIAHIDELESGVLPSSVPFSIVPKKHINYGIDENYKVYDVARDGVLIEEF